MFVRITKAPTGVEYVHTVEGYRDERGRSKQRIIASHGKLADLLAGDPDGLVKLKEQVQAAGVDRAAAKGVIVYDTSVPWDGGAPQNVGWLLVDSVLARLGAVGVMGRGTAGEVLRLLVCSRVVWPCSKFKAWERQQELFAGPTVPDWHEVYRVLDDIAAKSQALQQVAAASLERSPGSLAVVIMT